MDQDLQATQESRILQSNREKSKLERAIDEVEDRIEREHRNRLQKEKYKRKSEGELKLIEEQLEELNKAKGELERKIQQAEIIIRDLGVKIEEQEAFTSHIYKQTKISNIRIQDLEEEIESEYQTRQKSDRLQCDLQREITEVSEHLQDHMGMMDAQIQMNKKKELEIIRLRQELEEFNISQENMLANFRMENMQKVTVQNSDLERLRVEKTNIDKECEEMSSEKERINEILDGERKRKLEQERLLKMTHIQITELKKKWDDQMKKIQELTFQKSRIANENARLQQQIDDLQMQITNMQLSKAQHDNHLQDLRKRLEEGAKERSSLDLIAKSLNYDIKQLNDSIESEESEKVELRRILSKKNAEVQQWHERVEGAELIEVSELDELKQKQQMQIIQLHESLDATNSKITAIEKLKNHLTNDIEATRVECQLHMATATNLERKQAESNREIQIFKQNVNNIRCEVNAILRDKRNVSSNLFKLQSTNEGFEEQVELSKRENKTLIQELKILKDQYDNGARTFHEMQKLIHKLKIEKEELQQALTESEDSLHMEATKVTKLQNDKEQCKLDLEKQFQSREEEFNLIQRNHEHATESLQTSLDIERKSKAELLNQKKQHEMNINELEIELDQASRVNVDMQKSIKRYIELIKNLQKQLEEEQQTRQGFSSNQISTEKRIAVINSENEEITTSIMKLERAVNQHNNDWKECCEKIKELASKNSTLTSVKRKLEGEIQIARDDVQEVLKQLKAMDECNSKASADSVRLTEEVSQEREHAQHIERLSKGLELTLKATKAKLEDTEMAARKGIQRMIAEEEKRIKILQQEVDKECSQAQDATRLFHKNSRRSREIKLQLDEDQKAFTRLDELMNKLQKSLKAQKIHLDENSNLVLSNQQKYRELLMQLENAEERAAVAENSLLRMRTKSRIGNTLMNSQNEVLNSDQVVEKQ
ncbi:unnamed protein product [Thelazia callipaeda]|uniref:Myosin_tail_1 domain-containing protein n=1 Tax=Thelazia callipaeda TaxID=103827 RepID=A0A0N5CPK6_THECL|nr:unnamed protein product [Thelazia callipaeda]